MEYVNDSLPPDWLAKQIENTRAEVAAWPQWLKDVVERARKLERISRGESDV